MKNFENQLRFDEVTPMNVVLPFMGHCAKTNESVCMCAYLFSVPYAQPVFSRSGPNLARGILMVIKRFLQKDGETVISDSQSAIV